MSEPNYPNLVGRIEGALGVASNDDGTAALTAARAMRTRVEIYEAALRSIAQRDCWNAHETARLALECGAAASGPAKP